jgi:protease-4
MGDVIAIVYVNGTINDSLAQKTVRALKDIKKRDDVKCVILRINSPGGSAVASEAILEECKTMKRPYLCSFANVAASGGYYIASSAAHIFALDTTVTGSIGVFGVKLDLSHLANNYGINVAHISSGHHGASYSLFSPLSDTISENISRQLKRTYFYFKSLVSLGRKMSLDEVEKIAQGKIWVGKDAQYVGLVDEIGGISRAVAYAQRKYTSGHAIVECWPKAPSLIETGTRLFDSSSSNDGNDYIFNTDPVLRILPCRLQLSDPMLMMIDENSVLQYIVDSS